MSAAMSSRTLTFNPLMKSSSTKETQRVNLKVEAKASGKKTIRKTTKGREKKGQASLTDRILKAAKTPNGNEPNWIEEGGLDKVRGTVRGSRTKVMKKKSIYIGKEKSATLGNVGEPRTIDDFDEKYPNKEAYGPYGIFDNASGGWAGGEMGLKNMFLSAATEKLKAGTVVNVRYNLDPRSMPFSKMKGTVVKTVVGVNSVDVNLKMNSDPPDWWETAVYGASAVLLGGVLVVDGLVAGLGWDAADIAKFALPFTAGNAALIYFLITKNFLRRRHNGKVVTFPVEHIFVPGVDKVPDLFWDGSTKDDYKSL